MGKRELLANALERTRLGSLLSATVSRWQGVLVFNYHRIGDPSQTKFDRALWSATQDEFDRQVRFLRKHFDVIGIDDLGEVLRQSSTRGVLITFDDGYRDNFELAFPVLQQHSTTAVFFIASGFLDDRPVAWWDEIAWMINSATGDELPAFEWYQAPASLSDEAARQETIKQLLRTFKSISSDDSQPFLNRLAEVAKSGRCPGSVAETMWMEWDMVRQMDQAGMDIGGHTVTHPVLSQTSLRRQRREIFHSKQRIEQEIGHPIKAFSYPVGQQDSFTDETKQLLKEAGYDWAFSFFGGFASTGRADQFDLPRVAVSPHISPALFHSTARLPQIFA